MSGWTLGRLAEHVQLTLQGNPDAPVHGVGTLARARPGEVGFLANPRYRGELAHTAATAVVLHPRDADAFAGNRLISPNPYASFARIGALFEARETATPGIHPSAVVAPDAIVDPSASIGPFTSIGPRSRIDAGAVLGPGCVIGEDCTIGAGCELVARVTLVRRVRLGRRVLVHPGAVLGADGFGLAMDAGRWLKVPQLGGVVVGDDCEIGANTTIDRGAIEDTELAEDVRLDNQIQIGHNVRIGAHTAIAGCTAVAGSTTIGSGCLIGGAVGIAGHLELCDRVTITAMTLVSHSIHTPGEYSSGTPIQENRQWRRNAARFRHLDEIARRVNALANTKDTP